MNIFVKQEEVCELATEHLCVFLGKANNNMVTTVFLICVRTLWS